MKRRMRMKSPTITLPPEICTEILSRLPSKPLVRFRCVSKLWCSLIDDKSFNSTHLVNCPNNQEKSRLLVFEPADMLDNKQLLMIRRGNNFRKISSLGLDVTWYEHYQVTGYINGVICMKKYRVEIQVCQLILWNPSIRKILQLPMPHITHIVKNSDLDFAFGYDPIRNDYKVLATLYAMGGIQIPHFVELYSLKEQSWKGITTGKAPCSWSKGCPKAYLDGVTYIVGVDHLKTTPKGMYTHFVKFDVTNEVFTYIDLPDCEDIHSWEHERFPMILERSVALVDVYQAHTSIWIMEGSGVTKSWTKRHVIDLQLLYNFIHLKMNGELLFGGERGVKSCNIETQETIVLAKSYKLTPVFTDIYMESLELLKEAQPGPLCFDEGTQKMNVFNCKEFAHLILL